MTPSIDPNRSLPPTQESLGKPVGEKIESKIFKEALSGVEAQTQTFGQPKEHKYTWLHSVASWFKTTWLWKLGEWLFLKKPPKELDASNKATAVAPVEPAKAQVELEPAQYITLLGIIAGRLLSPEKKGTTTPRCAIEGFMRVSGTDSAVVEEKTKLYDACKNQTQPSLSDALSVHDYASLFKKIYEDLYDMTAKKLGIEIDLMKDLATLLALGKDPNKATLEKMDIKEAEDLMMRRRNTVSAEVIRLLMDNPYAWEHVTEILREAAKEENTKLSPETLATSFPRAKCILLEAEILKIPELQK